MKPIDSLSSDPTWFITDETMQKIYSFARLPDGWDYGIGKAPSNKVVQLAIYIYEAGIANGFAVDAFPETDGGIMLSLSLKDDFIKISISNDCSTMDLTHEKGFGQNYEILLDKENISLQDILYILKTIDSKWFSFERSTLKNTIQLQRDLPVTVSVSMDKAFPYLKNSAQLLRVEQYAPILINSTNLQSEPQYSFAE